ncbi:MAG: hypothetical protein GW875_11940 [Deltaproteobacteria bacterium]|nr:hypothetical protein [Deltaproteobacteria bacterium]
MKQLVFFLLLLLLPAHLHAELPTRLVADFAPLEGYIVLPTGEEEYLIDLDAGKGVHPGDIFSVLRTGRAVTHPVTGEVLGQLEEEAIFLRVTRLKSGYSYVKKISGAASINKGDKIKRFAAVPTKFSGVQSDLKSELQTKLNLLDWIPGDSGSPALLHFEVTGGKLRVTYQDNSVLFEYPLPQSVTNAPASLVTAPSVVRSSSGTPATEPGIIKSQQEGENVWHGAEYKDNIIGLRVDDFDQNGSQNIALLFSNRMVIAGYVNQKNQQKAEINLKKNLSYLAIDSLDLNQNGRPEIFLSAVRNGSPASEVYEFDGQKLSEVAQGLPMLFRTIDHPNRGKLLLAQKRHDLSIPFSERPQLTVFAEGEYRAEAEFPLPFPVNIYGFAPLIMDDNTEAAVYLSHTDYLKVKNSEGSDLYESADYFGGSEVMLGLKSLDRDDVKVPYFVPLRLIAANGAFLVPQNEGQRTTLAWRKYNKSRVVSLKWNGLALEEQWKTSDQAGQTADLAYADIDNDGQPELVLGVNFVRKGLFNTPKSALIVYEMNP